MPELEKKKWVATDDVAERTEVLYDFEDILACALNTLPKIKKTHDLCLDKWGPSAILGTEPVRDGYIELANRGVRIRLITEVSNTNIEHCKEFMKFSEVRHLDKVKGHFSISDKKWYTASSEAEKDKPPPRLIYCTVKEIIDQHQSFFETLWNKAIPAEQRIKEIEEGIEPTNVEFISNPRESIKRAWDLISSAKNEVVVMLSSPTAFRRQMGMGGLEVIQKAIRNGAKVRLLIPTDKGVSQALNQVKCTLPEAEFRAMDASLTTSITIVLVDKKDFMFFELRDDTATESHKAVGLALYSNSRTIVTSYGAILEAIWKQSELNEQIRQANEKLESACSQLEAHENAQKEFINVAAHELRTPIQPLLGLSELVQQTMDGKDKIEITKDEMEMIVRNAKRLERLSSDILDVSRIEGKSLKLNVQGVNLAERIQDVIHDVTAFISSDQQLRITFENNANVPVVRGDAERLSQVLSNVLRNAIKFTKEGSIRVILQQRGDQAVVRITDTGSGIDAEIFPRLFTKFATKSDQGTGLGLYLSKGIIEAHGGRIWGENNIDGKGATFTLTIPLFR